jgi:hypothetical protein
MVVAGLAVFLIASLGGTSAQQTSSPAIRVDNDDIGGVVTSSKGPEAGVWVIAETTDLPTKLNKTVVTDDQGRYLIPDLPKANYSVWVRGYGLVDSRKVQTAPGKSVNLTAVIASSPREAAQYYPAGYWWSLMQIPAKNEFPGTGPTGNGISPNVKSQADFVRLMKSGGCTACHQLGTRATREIPESLGKFPSSIAAWERRIKSGQAGGNMDGGLNQLGRERALKVFADWTDRIAKGEYPQQAPARPQGVERNVVITQWDWADPKVYLHDVVSTDRRNPTVNANGKLYGALELSADYVPVVDPISHKASQIPLTVRDQSTPRTSANIPASSPYWGDEVIWTSRNNVHNPMLDEKGRLWLTSAVRPNANPDFCKEGSNHPSAKLFPVANAGRHLAVYDPKTEKITHISTCFGTHHLMFAEDANNTLWTSGGGQVVGWLNTKMFDETGDEQRSQGWTALIMDTNGNGKRDAYVEPNQPLDPTKDKRIGGAFYAVSPAPDGSVWGSMLGFPGAVIRLVPGSNPPETAIAEMYEPPFEGPNGGFSPRGMDVDRNGVAWVALASGHMASFDRRKCKASLNGPKATGQHCPEGWTLYPEPLPQMKGVTDSGSSEASYYTWVDQFDTFGLGRNTPINTGNASEGLLALKDGKWVVLRVPYPTGFYTKWLDGRIDDPKAGWKGKGLWATVSTRAPFHMETGKGTSSKVMKFQLRPDPLAR